MTQDYNINIWHRKLERSYTVNNSYSYSINFCRQRVEERYRYRTQSTRVTLELNTEPDITAEFKSSSNIIEQHFLLHFVLRSDTRTVFEYTSIDYPYTQEDLDALVDWIEGWRSVQYSGSMNCRNRKKYTSGPPKTRKESKATFVSVKVKTVRILLSLLHGIRRSMFYAGRSRRLILPL